LSSAAGPNISIPDTKSKRISKMPPPLNIVTRINRGSPLGSSGTHGVFAPQDGHVVAS